MEDSLEAGRGTQWAGRGRRQGAVPTLGGPASLDERPMPLPSPILVYANNPYGESNGSDEWQTALVYT